MAEFTTAARLMASIFFVTKNSDIDITANTYSLPDDAVSSAFMWTLRD
jgi:hypothetical protein